jgi:adenylate cyclase
MSFLLEALREGSPRLALPLATRGAQRLGTAPEAELRCLSEPSLSGLQAELRVQGGALWIRRLPGAINRIFVHGEAVEEARLEAGDCFVVGRTRFVVHKPEPSLPPNAPDSLVMPERLRLLDLLELPELLRLQSLEESLLHVASLLRLITGAESAEIIDEGGAGSLLARDAVQDSASIQPVSPELRARALLEGPQAVWAVERGNNGSGLDWAIACHLSVPGRAPLLFHLRGHGGPERRLPEKARLAALIADMAARSVGLKKLEGFQERLEHYFSGPVAAKIMRSADPAELEPRLAKATILFFDIRGFSRLAEHEASEALASVKELRRVMTAMTEEIFAEGGVVIQYMGDGILACWNLPYDDPQAEDHAARAALRMVARLARERPDWKCGIGLHAGEVVAGSLGSEQVFSYNVMGTVVNQASRVEGITKVVECPILATGEVAARLSPQAAQSRRLGRFQPAGMDNDLVLFELRAPDAAREGGDALKQGLAAFERGDWEAAYAFLDQLPPTDLPARYLKALAEMHRRKPPKDWRGIIELEGK